jgi:hypothetical protein
MILLLALLLLAALGPASASQALFTFSNQNVT